ncbi:hypothetical protein [Sphingomonas sp.]|uniref:hypothetical protein n=1 Tax=Sphingomonas sp. TaxID=28214 RepID=UPI003B00D1A1
MRVLRSATALTLAMAAGAAFAHPVHEVVQNAYITLSPGTVGLELELTAGPQVAGKIIRALDSNGDRRIGPAEANAFADRMLAQSRLTIDGRSLAIRTLSVEMPSYAALLGAHGTIRIVAAAARPDRAGPATLAYRNGYSPAESRCDANIFLRAGGQMAYRIQGQDRSPDGRALVVHYSTTTG